MDKTFKFALPSPNFNKNAKDALKPKPHFLTPSGMSLLPREKQPPPMYGKHGATLPPIYLPAIATGQQQLKEEHPVKQYCEPCELELQSIEDLKRHRAQHEICPVEGCTFKGHPSVMDKHINGLHASGLFDKFKKLSTPEEIAAWREERKKRYPTLANVILKQKAQEQRQKRGERLEASKNRFGKVGDRKRAQPKQNEVGKDGDQMLPREGKSQHQKNKRNRKNKRNQKPRQQHAIPEVKKENELTGESKEETAEVSCGGIKIFRGTGQMKNYKHLNDKKKLPANNALFGLVGMYGSDDESEENDSEDQSIDSEDKDTNYANSENMCANNDVIKECERNYNRDAYENVKADHYEQPNGEPSEISSQLSNSNLCLMNIKQNEGYTVFHNEIENKTKTMDLKSRQFSDIGSITLPDDTISPANVKNTKENSIEDHLPIAINENSSDEAPEEAAIQRSIPEYSINSEKVLASQTNEEPLAKRCKPSEEHLKKKQLAKRKSGLDYRKVRLRKQNTMLEKLLEADIRHERNVLLQCVRYVCENNYFGVGQTKPD